MDGSWVPFMDGALPMSWGFAATPGASDIALQRWAPERRWFQGSTVPATAVAVSATHDAHRDPYATIGALAPVPKS